jgi:hypothetical protein
MIMPKKKAGSPPHGDKYRHLAALKPPFRSESAVLPPLTQKAKAKQKPQPKQAEDPKPDSA